ncbi:metallopeptidase family protein [Candidatus Saccharibacteria bacterium]|nr:metallopeptidase family protein [Candidatus Saccharibacteria bacterium]MCB9821647.1 metallopeptidase family protein [Candidatus Nomurabacteria bacterium]
MNQTELDQPLDDLFELYIKQSLDELPQDYIANLNNVAITTADYPDVYQTKKSSLKNGQLLLGLYEGIPLSRRGTGTTMALPDKITLFRIPLLKVSKSSSELQAKIKQTLWHEIAHYYGLNHHDMAKLQQANKQAKL